MSLGMGNGYRDFNDNTVARFLSWITRRSYTSYM